MIYIVTHKRVDLPKLKGYRAILFRYIFNKGDYPCGSRYETDYKELTNNKSII